MELLNRAVPVQQLLGLPVLARARRVKGMYTSDQVDALKGFGQEIRDAFDRLRAEYGKDKTVAADERR